MNETQYQLFLSGLTEFFRGNVLTLDDFDLEIPAATHTDDPAPPYDQVTRNTVEYSGVERNRPVSPGLGQNDPDLYGVLRNIPELLEEPIVLDP